MANMADESSDNIWARKYLTLETRVKQIELENKRLVNRIYHVRKHLKRARREKSYLTKKCEEYGVDYEKARPEYMAQMLADINAAYDDPRSQLKKSASLTKKGRGRTHYKLDPDAPKKPANAFFMFCQQQRNSMHDDQKDSTVGHHELTKHLAKEWNTLAAEGKKVYYKMYEKDKARYEKEMKQYAKEKVPKDQSKLLKTKKQKSKKTSTQKVLQDAKISPDSIQTSSENTALVSESPTSQFNLLNSLSLTNLSSPMLDLGGDDEEDSFNTFDYNTV